MEIAAMLRLTLFCLLRAKICSQINCAVIGSVNQTHFWFAPGENDRGPGEEKWRGKWSFGLADVCSSFICGAREKKATNGSFFLCCRCVYLFVQAETCRVTKWRRLVFRSREKYISQCQTESYCSAYMRFWGKFGARAGHLSGAADALVDMHACFGDFYA
jgi:hypothetical protein